ncbi:MAG TPA: septal ring lytic transglycosylase RlpA family protein [Gaiellaceae bacterium]|nr:septal ring lytic transglycosylase RlpA family protein [Gaiellaceae bacterium]
MVGLRRLLVLAAAALLVGVAVLAVRGWRSERSRPPRSVGDFVALAGSAGPTAFGHHTKCGGVIGPDTLGIAHPTLPCGARIYITYRGLRVLTAVIDRGPYEAGRQFDVTDALARRLGLQGVQQVHWSYAGP